MSPTNNVSSQNSQVFRAVSLADSTIKSVKLLAPWCDASNFSESTFSFAGDIVKQAQNYAIAINLSVNAAKNAYTVAKDATSLSVRIIAGTGTEEQRQSYLEHIMKMGKDGHEIALKTLEAFRGVRVKVHELLNQVKSQPTYRDVEVIHVSVYINGSPKQDTTTFGGLLDKFQQGIDDLEQFSEHINAFATWWNGAEMDLNALKESTNHLNSKYNSLRMDSVVEEWKERGRELETYTDQIRKVQDSYPSFFRVPTQQGRDLHARRKPEQELQEQRKQERESQERRKQERELQARREQERELQARQGRERELQERQRERELQARRKQERELQERQDRERKMQEQRKQEREFQERQEQELRARREQERELQEQRQERELQERQERERTRRKQERESQERQEQESQEQWKQERELEEQQKLERELQARRNQERELQQRQERERKMQEKREHEQELQRGQEQEGELQKQQKQERELQGGQEQEQELKARQEQEREQKWEVPESAVHMERESAVLPGQESSEETWCCCCIM